VNIENCISFMSCDMICYIYFTYMYVKEIINIKYYVDNIVYIFVSNYMFLTIDDAPPGFTKSHSFPTI